MPAGSQSRSRTRGPKGVPLARSAMSAARRSRCCCTQSARPVRTPGHVRQHPQIGLAAGQQVDGHRHHVLRRIRVRLLVEVVVNARSVTQQMLDGHSLHRLAEGPPSTASEPESPARALPCRRASSRRSGDPLVPLAMPKRVSTLLAMPGPRCARPYAPAKRLVPRSTRTTPRSRSTRRLVDRRTEPDTSSVYVRQVSSHMSRGSGQGLLRRRSRSHAPSARRQASGCWWCGA